MSVAPVTVAGRRAFALRVSANRWDALRGPMCWSLIVGFVVLMAIFLVLHRGELLLLLFPAGALGIGAILYVVDAPLFIGFAWWLWFLTPEVRRLVDDQTGWNPTSTVMLAPYLVSALSLISVCYRLPLLWRKEMAPFAAIFAALAYGMMVGAVKESPQAALFGFLTWGVPVAFAFHLAAHAADYPAISRTLLRTFVWGGLVMGAYGLFQFFLLPAWDVYWMIHVGMDNEGHPYPQEVRVFSTMNSSGPFSFVLLACLLMLFVGGGYIRLPAAVVGYGSFLLGLVRAAWIGWAVGFAALAFRLRKRSRVRLLAAACGTAIVVLPTVTLSPLDKVVAARMDTFSDLQDDDSYQQRREFYLEFLAVAVTTVEGAGIGSVGVSTKLTYTGQPSRFANFDSGIMQIPFVLGWFGSAAYLAGLFLLVRSALAAGAAIDPVAAAAQAVVLSFLALMVFANSLIAPEGTTFWTFLGLALAAHRYGRLHPALPRAVPT